MKILKIFGIVVGIHLFALILIFANPGCSSTTKPAPSPGDTASADTSPVISVPSSSSSASTATNEAASSAITFNPDTPAAAAPAGADTGVRFTPTRPGTPVAGALVAEPVADVTPATTYTVKSGDNLWTLARRNNLTVSQLAAANSLSANAGLRPGQKLIIPGRPASASAAATATGGAGTTTKSTDPVTAPAINRSGGEVVKHVVKSGETLGAIARKYGVRQGELAVANNISDPAKIRPGMELTIPGWQAPGAKSGKATKSTNGADKAPPPSAPSTFESLPSEPAPAAPPPVPVIRIDDSPAPAPKQP
jgi:LysM repeat protein